MTKNLVLSGVVALIVAVVATILVLAGSPASTEVQPQATLGSTMETVLVTLGGGVQVGGSGTPLKLALAGTVNCTDALASPGVVTSSSTKVMDCNVRGVRSGDTVILARPAAMTASWFYVGAYASTTARDYFEAVLYNAGASALAPATATSSVPYFIFRR